MPVGDIPGRAAGSDDQGGGPERESSQRPWTRPERKCEYGEKRERQTVIFRQDGGRGQQAEPDGIWHAAPVKISGIHERSGEDQRGEERIRQNSAGDVHEKREEEQGDASGKCKRESD